MTGFFQNRNLNQVSVEHFQVAKSIYLKLQNRVTRLGMSMNDFNQAMGLDAAEVSKLFSSTESQLFDVDYLSYMTLLRNNKRKDQKIEDAIKAFFDEQNRRIMTRKNIGLAVRLTHDVGTGVRMGVLNADQVVHTSLMFNRHIALAHSSVRFGTLSLLTGLGLLLASTEPGVTYKDRIRAVLVYMSMMTVSFLALMSSPLLFTLGLPMLGAAFIVSTSPKFSGESDISKALGERALRAGTYSVFVAMIIHFTHLVLPLTIGFLLFDLRNEAVDFVDKIAAYRAAAQRLKTMDKSSPEYESAKKDCELARNAMLIQSMMIAILISVLTIVVAMISPAFATYGIMGMAAIALAQGTYTVMRYMNEKSQLEHEKSKTAAVLSDDGLINQLKEIENGTETSEPPSVVL